MTEIESWMTVARVIRPQGRRGEVLAEILTDFPDRFAAMRAAFVRQGNRATVPVVIENAWFHKGRVVLKFAGTDSISAAEELRGTDVVIPAGDRMALAEDAAYIGDLIGCSVVDVGRPGSFAIGTIRDVICQETTADLLVVVDGNGVEHSIPFAKEYLVRIDLPGRTLEMNLPAGLLEVNAPMTEEERRAQRTETSPGRT